MELVAINKRTGRPILDIDPLPVAEKWHYNLTSRTPGLDGLLEGVAQWWNGNPDSPVIVWNGDPDDVALGVCGCCRRAFRMVDLHITRELFPGLECGNCSGSEQSGCMNCHG